jgi:hypothetical protein
MSASVATTHVRAKVLPAPPSHVVTRRRAIVGVGVSTILALLVVLVGVVSAYLDYDSVALAALAGIFAAAYAIPAILCLGMLISMRRRRRDVDLHVTPGTVRAPRFVLRAEDVVGASTAVLRDEDRTGALADARYLLSVATREGTLPSTLAFANAEDLRAVRQALGVSREGTREMSWSRARPPGFLPAIVVLVCAWAAAPIGAIALWALPWFIRASKPSERIELLPYGLRFWHKGEVVEVPYRDIDAVTPYAGGLQVFRQSTPFFLHLGDMPAVHHVYLAAQIRTAAERARQPKVDESHFALRRGDEAHAAWFGRLDATPLHADYRSAGVSPGELWRVAEDPDSSLEERVAAGRLLVRVEGERARVRIHDVMANLPLDLEAREEVLYAEPQTAARAMSRARE